MPILDTQRRLTEIGRIRMGEKNQRGMPVKLANFRLTSPNRDILTEVANIYGGEVTVWDEEFQVTIDKPLDILLPTTDGIFSEWYEEWSAGGIKKRCDGVSDDVRDCACDCIPGQRDCKPTSRLSVWLPEIESFGVWMLSSTGYNANAELGGTVAALQQAAVALGRPVKATLRLDQRKRAVSGQTRRFSVPVIEPREAVKAILEAPMRVAALPAPTGQPEQPSLELPPPPDSMKWPEVEVPEEDWEVLSDGRRLDPNSAEGKLRAKEHQAARETYVDSPDPTRDETYERHPVDTSNDIIGANLQKQIVISCREIGLTDDERHDLVTFVTEGRTNSTKEIQEGELNAIWRRMDAAAMSKALVLMKDLWDDQQTAYAEIREHVAGTELAPANWQFNSWKNVLVYCQNLIKTGDQNDS